MSTAEESISYGNQTAKAFTLTSALWFALATTFGMIAAGYLGAPDFMANIEYIQFGRVRPMHVNAVLFGFVTPRLIAVAFYFLPRLMKTRLYSEKLGVFSAVFWNFTVAAGMVGVSLGHSQGTFIVSIMTSNVIVFFYNLVVIVYGSGPTFCRVRESTLQRIKAKTARNISR